MSGPKILLVDDDKTLRCNLQEQLEIHGFEVVTASGVNDALQCIIAEPFDVLLTDLHMPGDADGLTVVSAMRNAHPKAVTLVYSGYPEMRRATNAILLQADQILLKPIIIQDLILPTAPRPRDERRRQWPPSLKVLATRSSSCGCHACRTTRN
jgi:DNA-binding NtrC family response regulator